MAGLSDADLSRSEAHEAGLRRRGGLMVPPVLTKHIGSQCPTCIESWTRFGTLPSLCATCGVDRRDLSQRQICLRCGDITVTREGLKPSSSCMGCGTPFGVPRGDKLL